METETTSKSSKTEKRRPGRPPKEKVQSIHIEHFGIVDKPHIEDDIVEIVYDNPKMFKKILSILKQYNVTEVKLVFLKKKIIIPARSDNGRIDVFIEIDCNLLVRYYCKEPIERCVKRVSLEQIFSKLDKHQNQVDIILKESDNKSKLYINIKDSETDNIDHYHSEIIPGENDVPSDLPDISKYPVKFELPSKKFKDTVDKISKLSSHMSFSNSGNILSIQYDGEKNTCTSVFQNSSKILFSSTLHSSDIFQISLRISDIKPISAANVGKNIAFIADKEKPIAVTLYMDDKKYTQNDKIVEGNVCKIQSFIQLNKFQVE